MIDYPKFIEIQFNNACNSNCLICPYKDMHYKYCKMNDELFNKFISEINENKLIRIIPYLNNEPFLDKDYVKKLYIIRKKCPDIEMEISTNASLLDENIIKKLVNLNLTELRISVFGYSDKLYKKMMPNLNKNKVFENLNIISTKFKNSYTTVSIVMIDDGSIDEYEFNSMENLAKKLNFKFERWGFLDRSKNVCYKKNNFYSKNICGCEQNRPLERMHILANGDVILCCQDWKHTVILGNINENTITQIWNSQKYNEIRNKIYIKECDAPEICKNCKLAITF